MHSPQAGWGEKSQILKEVFGFQDFRPGQEAVIDAIFNGEKLIVVMPTGSGKSLCYQIPALGLGGLTVVVSPLVALMQDQVSALNLAGVKAETINSSRDRVDNVASWRRVASGETRLLYLSPERLMTERMLGALEQLPLALLVIDEAHCISQWGPSFRPEYADLSRLKDLFPNIPLAAFTATADELTRKDIIGKLFAGEISTFIHGIDRPNIRLAVEQKQDWRQQLLAFVDKHAGECGIVYCLSRKKTEMVAQLLTGKGVRALPYHAGMEKTEREANQNLFMTKEGVVMAATIAFGMGIDKPDVRFVLHTDLPATMETYYQEFGRAGRDGKPATALMLYGLEDIRLRRHFIEQEEATEEHKRRQHKRLDALLAYCESPECRRLPLFAYFGEQGQPCGNCDVCLNPIETKEGSDAGQKALAAVSKTGQRFGMAHIIDVLRGKNNEKVRSQEHDKLSTFGVGEEISKEEWRSIFRQLVAGGFLSLDIQNFGGLSIAEKGHALLKGEESFRYRMDVFKTPRQKRRPRALAPNVSFTGNDAPLLAKLKELRLTLAKERQVPPFVIFHDRTLKEMANCRPKSIEEFADINGVGKAKLAEFAQPFLKVIAGEGG